MYVHESHFFAPDPPQHASTRRISFGQAPRSVGSGVPQRVSTALLSIYNYTIHVYNSMYSPYVIRSEDHDHHMTVFPSMRPAGRHEAVTLKVGPHTHSDSN